MFQALSSCEAFPAKKGNKFFYFFFKKQNYNNNAASNSTMSKVEKRQKNVKSQELSYIKIIHFIEFYLWHQKLDTQ
jgi:hypothetical protein